jgi:hypothetical protein
MGHPGLMVPGAVSLSEAMGTTHFVLNQVHDVLRREREASTKSGCTSRCGSPYLRSGQPLRRRRRR